MNYEEKYKEDLEAAKGWLAIAKENNNNLVIQILEKLFPELRESEDEQHCKWILEYLYDSLRKSDEQFKDQFKSAIAWLEKQTPVKFNDENDEKIRKELLESFKYQQRDSRTNKEWLNGIKLSEVVAWLEKQGEKPIEQDAEFNDLWVYIKEFRDKLGRLPKDEDELASCVYYVMKKQKPADKVEPKFKVGDWIINPETRNILQIKNVLLCGNKGNYEFDNSSMPIESVDRYYKQWTIEDAKDGDVLVTWNNTTFIFKNIEDDVVKYYIAYNEKWDEEIRVSLSNDSHVGLAESQFEFKPATKEQRNTLMKAMADAGYTFDFEKKKLKKIEQKPYPETLNKAIELYYYSYGNEKCGFDNLSLEKFKDIIKAFVEDYGNKSTWSEEDEKMISFLIKIFEANHPNGHFKVNPIDTTNMEAISTKEIVDWLKSLKPQSHWKPSEEQMKWLKDVIDTVPMTCRQQMPLESLYNDLKKL